ncbi:protein of unknown function [Arachidicoccus rhizosphaerae]|jgi:hypothetical protein|uniref:DUF4251 domain-containing protein n=1 Tax=Arachidicoccus rhizosphaerae TaxID=551991 RepID=A0A1H3VSD3_9BACT|nr:DUF4251 domain-containing protein [Arachidicoccus rhizosphaerae]SDZ77687.1 protein of unknown function [Arachidicoccus rhizosphaerae]
MKTAFIALFSMAILSLAACSATKSNIDKTAEQEKVGTLVQSGSFVYNATSANPLRTNVLSILPNGGGQQLRQLGAGYYLSVTRDSLKVHLPFYGRSYQAEMDPTKGGIDFESTDFKYSYETSKRGYYIATIKVNNQKSADKLILNISSNGYTTLQVQSINRDQMGFYGKIEAQKSDILNGN